MIVLLLALEFHLMVFFMLEPFSHIVLKSLKNNWKLVT